MCPAKSLTLSGPFLKGEVIIQALGGIVKGFSGFFCEFRRNGAFLPRPAADAQDRSLLDDEVHHEEKTADIGDKGVWFAV